MGPHEACFYCDIGMSYFDELIFSEQNPHRQPLVWTRYRDDVYDPWVHGEQELLSFTDWLNSLNERLKFPLMYRLGNGIENLDTYIYDADGKLHTDLYSKPSDTHAYLPPSSCHPYHVCKNNPRQVARRIRKICSEQHNYSAARDKFSTLLLERGYSKESIADSFAEFDHADRAELFNKTLKDTTSDSKKVFPLVTEFNPHLPAITPVLNKHKKILLLDH